MSMYDKTHHSIVISLQLIKKNNKLRLDLKKKKKKKKTTQTNRPKLVVLSTDIDIVTTEH